MCLRTPQSGSTQIVHMYAKLVLQHYPFFCVLSEAFKQGEDIEVVEEEKLLPEDFANLGHDNELSKKADPAAPVAQACFSPYSQASTPTSCNSRRAYMRSLSSLLRQLQLVSLFAELKVMSQAGKVLRQKFLSFNDLNALTLPYCTDSLFQRHCKTWKSVAKGRKLVSLIGRDKRWKKGHLLPIFRDLLPWKNGQAVSE